MACLVTVLAFTLDQLDGESANTAWQRQTVNSSSCPAAACLLRLRPRRTISRAVTAWPLQLGFLFNSNGTRSDAAIIRSRVYVVGLVNPSSVNDATRQ
jgi:hypothetical protein